MNYSNMIEEKSLKKTFIIATLISTIIGTFTTGINLYERVSERRNQKHRDTSQDAKIQALEKRADEAQAERDKHRQANKDLRASLRHGGPMIQREYDEDFRRMGPKFAEGDLLAQTQLQGHVITLQSTVIKMLETALVTGTVPDINRLYNASEFAREGSIRALRDQYQRLLQAVPPQRGALAARPVGPVRRTSSTPALRDTALITAGGEPTRRGTGTGGALVPFAAGGPLFCRYAEALQRSRRRLDDAFDTDGGGGGLCPSCGTRFDIKPGRAWKFDSEVVRGDGDGVQILEERTYAISNRFLLKCHRPGGGGFACFLCFRHRDRDTLCDSMETLVSHVVNKHGVADYEAEVDIRDVTPPYR